MWLLKNAGASDGARLAIGAAPALTLILIARGVLRMIRQQDELYKRIQFEAIAYAAGFATTLSYSLGMLESMQLIPHVGIAWAGNVLIVTWGIAAGILSRRYG